MKKRSKMARAARTLALAAIVALGSTALYLHLWGRKLAGK